MTDMSAQYERIDETLRKSIVQKICKRISTIPASDEREIIMLAKELTAINDDSDIADFNLVVKIVPGVSPETRSAEIEESIFKMYYDRLEGTFDEDNDRQTEANVMKSGTSGAFFRIAGIYERHVGVCQK